VKTVRLPDRVVEKLEQVEGKDLAEKIIHLLQQQIEVQLRDCDEQVLKYEIKYGMDYKQFQKAWKHNEIPDKHSHEVERDLMEWEGYMLERQRWLARSLSLMTALAHPCDGNLRWADQTGWSRIVQFESSEN
jgi:hypothetical protein